MQKKALPDRARNSKRSKSEPLIKVWLNICYWDVVDAHLFQCGSGSRFFLSADPDPDLWSQTNADPDPDPGSKTNKDVNVPGAHLNPDPYVFGPPGPASGSFSQSHGSEDPDPYQNVADPQHCFCKFFFKMGNFF